MRLAKPCLASAGAWINLRVVILQRILLLLGLFLSALAPASASPCAPAEPCRLETGHYLARPPSGWNGSDPLTALVFFHGWREKAESVLVEPALIALADAHGLLLVAPQGEGLTWSYPGSPGRHRDEFVFVGQMMTDLARRFPLQPGKSFASGFSQGGSMVWYLACYQPQPFAGFLSIAGGFWEPAPRDCPGGPVALVHVHGVSDATVPLQGRTLRGGLYRQADILRDWPVWTKPAACEGTAQPQPDATSPDYLCQTQVKCRAGAAPILCLRPGGHALTAEDLAIGWRLLMSAPASNP